MMSSSATSAAAFAAAMARAGHSSRCTPLLLRLRLREKALDPRRVRGQAQVLAASACA
jgi:hypothetical protein